MYHFPWYRNKFAAEKFTRRAETSFRSSSSRWTEQVIPQTPCGKVVCISAGISGSGDRLMDGMSPGVHYHLTEAIIGFDPICLFI